MNPSHEKMLLQLEDAADRVAGAIEKVENDDGDLTPQAIVGEVDDAEVMKINIDALAEPQAMELEENLIAEHQGKLVNWFDSPSEFVLSFSLERTELSLPQVRAEELGYCDALRRFNELRSKTMQSVRGTRVLEDSEPETAMVRYLEALDRVREYTRLSPVEPV